MSIRLLLRCLLHPRSWRNCVEDVVKRDPKIMKDRDERYAAIISTRRLNRGEPIMVNGVEYTTPHDPVTDRYRGIHRRPVPRAPRKGPS